MPMSCSFGDAEPVAMIITNQITAETDAYCMPHFVEWVLAAHAAMTAPDTETAELAAQLRQAAVGATPPPDLDSAVNGHQGAARTPRKRTPRKGKESASEHPAQDHADEPAPF